MEGLNVYEIWIIYTKTLNLFVILIFNYKKNDKKNSDGLIFINNIDNTMSNIWYFAPVVQPKNFYYKG